MNVVLYEGSPDDAALEIASCGSWEGDFADLEFPSDVAREEARATLARDGRAWLDRTTLCVRVP